MTPRDGLLTVGWLFVRTVLSCYLWDAALGHVGRGRSGRTVKQTVPWTLFPVCLPFPDAVDTSSLPPAFMVASRDVRVAP